MSLPATSASPAVIPPTDAAWLPSILAFLADIGITVEFPRMTRWLRE